MRARAVLSAKPGIINGIRDEGSVLEQTISGTMDAPGSDMGCVYPKDEGDELALALPPNKHLMKERSGKKDTT